MHAYVIHGVGHAPQEIFILNHAGLVIEGIYLQDFIQAGSPFNLKLICQGVLQSLHALQKSKDCFDSIWLPHFPLVCMHY